jgi:hypothetical protein
LPPLVSQSADCLRAVDLLASPGTKGLSPIGPLFFSKQTRHRPSHRFGAGDPFGSAQRGEQLQLFIREVHDCSHDAGIIYHCDGLFNPAAGMTIGDALVRQCRSMFRLNTVVGCRVFP